MIKIIFMTGPMGYGGMTGPMMGVYEGSIKNEILVILRIITNHSGL